MPPSFATLVFAVGILGLFLLDRQRGVRTSPALWLPVVWLSLSASRNVSVWLGVSPAVTASADQYLEGSPLDRAILSGLIAIGLVVLIARGRQAGEILRRNIPLVVFFLYCAASITWSDFPFVALKRWTKVLGNVVMVLVVLTNPDPAISFKKFLTQPAFLLIPSSILLIKYYPELGRSYDRWEGTTFYSGVTIDKNMLGVLCLISGLGILSRFIDTFRETGQQNRRFLALGTVLAMTLWLFYKANSATSLGCFIAGSTLIVVLSLFRSARPSMVHLMVGAMAVVSVVAYVFPIAFAVLVQSAGRDTTLTGRTDLWKEVLKLNTQPLFGTGFESFFLGPRLEILWSKFWWHPNEAHNGYLETYLTLGIVGLCLMGMLLVTGYGHAMNVYRRDPSCGALRLAFLVIAPIYNITEAAFKVTNPIWILFLLAVTAVPHSKRDEDREKDPSAASRIESGRFQRMARRRTRRDVIAASPPVQL